MTSKHAIKSKTVWGVVLIALGILADGAFAQALADAGASWAPYAAQIAGAFLAVYGRLVASQPVHVIPKKPETP